MIYSKKKSLCRLLTKKCASTRDFYHQKFKSIAKISKNKMKTPTKKANIGQNIKKLKNSLSISRMITISNKSS